MNKAEIDAHLLAEIRARDEEVHVSPQWVGWAHSPFAQFIADRRLLLVYLDRAVAGATAAENERIAVRLEEAITALMMKGMLLNDAEIKSLYAALR